MEDSLNYALLLRESIVKPFSQLASVFEHLIMFGSFVLNMPLNNLARDNINLETGKVKKNMCLLYINSCYKQRRDEGESLKKQI